MKMKKRTYEIAVVEEDALAHVQAMAQRLLRSKNLKNKDLAKAMGVSEPHISNLLNGDPPNLSIKAAARLFYHLDEELIFTCAGIEALDRAASLKHGRPRFEICKQDVNWNTTQETKDQDDAFVNDLAPAA